MIPGRQFLGKRYDGFGAVEGVASGVGIATRAREVLKDQRSPEDLAAITAEDVFDAARRHEPWARSVLDEALDYLAILIASLTTYFDPELIVMGGGVARSADMLIEPILQRIDGTIPVQPKLVASTLGTRATVSGAITNVLHNTSDFYVVHKLS